MKQEAKDLALQLVASSPTTIWALLSRVTIAEWVAIILGVMQGLYLLRKWWREETTFGLTLKRMAHVRPTKPAELDT